LQTNSAEISLSKTHLIPSPKMSTHTPMKTIVYVDGLNLYYGSLRGTAFKWLDLYALFSDYVLGIDTELDHVRYYTAPMKASSSDDPASPLRQQRYLRALKAYRGDRIQIIQGLISRTTPVLRLARPCTKVANGGKARVFQFTEKQTDVNLAADLISDSCHGRCQQVVLCSNDSDFAGALAAVRRDHSNVIVGLVAPVREERHVANALNALAWWRKVIHPEQLAQAQLPERIPGTQLTRPERWKEIGTPRDDQSALPSHNAA
jgi:uncharacterized LabA/DUF88 family protein